MSASEPFDGTRGQGGDNHMLLELFRKSSREGHKLTAYGMNERQGTGVESKTTYRRRLRSILPVTCYRTTQLSRSMNPDLILATRIEMELH